MAQPIPAASDVPFGPWNPGIRSTIPRELRPLATIFRRENVFTELDYADELRDLTGLPLTELVAFRPQRLALHELLVRITADLSVPDGSRIEDLGINFREMTRVILERYMEPQRAAIAALYDDVRRQVAACVARELDALYAPAAPAPAPRTLRSLWSRSPVAVAAVDEPDRALRLIDKWQRDAESGGDPVQRAARSALAKATGGCPARRGPW